MKARVDQNYSNNNQVISFTFSLDELAVLDSDEHTRAMGLLRLGDTPSLIEVVALLWNAQQVDTTYRASQTAGTRYSYNYEDIFRDTGAFNADDIRRAAGEYWEKAHATYQGNPFQGSTNTNRGKTSDCWAVLGIKSTATKTQIKAAYRKLALKHHPDKGGSASKFNKINQAYKEALL